MPPPLVSAQGTATAATATAATAATAAATAAAAAGTATRPDHASPLSPGHPTRRRTCRHGPRRVLLSVDLHPLFDARNAVIRSGPPGQRPPCAPTARRQRGRGRGRGRGGGGGGATAAAVRDDTSVENTQGEFLVLCGEDAADLLARQLELLILFRILPALLRIEEGVVRTD